MRALFTWSLAAAICVLLLGSGIARAQTATAAATPVPSPVVVAVPPAPTAVQKPLPPAAKPSLPDPPASGASTPRRSLQAFVRAAEAKDFQKAAEWIDLRGLPRGKDAREGPELAAMLHRILVTRVSLDPEELPDEPAPAGLGADGLVIDRVELDGSSHVFALTQVRQLTGEVRWQFSRASAASIRPVYEATQKRVVEEAVPLWLKERAYFSLQPWQWLGVLLLAVFSYGVGRLLGSLLIGGIVRLLAAKSVADGLRSLGRAARLALATVTFQAFVPYVLLPAQLSNVADRIGAILYIIAIAWSLILLVRVAASAWERRLPDDTHAELENRGLRTRLLMMRRIATALIGIVGTGVVLLQFEIVRNIGLSLLASAGIAGVLVGIAAQRTLGGVIAGIELSITQPIRIGDVVVFRPGELGTVEQIFFTYIIVRLWDDRRMIVPVTKVMSEPFENWTRSGADLLAPVEIFVDYAAPVEELRAAWRRLCEASPLWDQRVSSVEVVEVTDRAVHVRGIASVDVATKAHPLKCELREGWVKFLQTWEEGRYLPLSRVESREADTVTQPEAGASSAVASSRSRTSGSPPG